MSIFIDGNTRLLVQGITGRDGSFHTRADDRVRDGRRRRRHAGQGRPDVSTARPMPAVPIFNTVADAAEATGANAR